MSYANDVLVSSDWVAERLHADGVVLAEVDENTDLYEEGHIPGAVKLHWQDDLQDPVERDIVGKDRFEQLLGERGIGNDTTVVLYGDKNNWFAAYAYWYLSIYGHKDVRILDGGRQKWIDEDRELTTEAPSRSAPSGRWPRTIRVAAATRCSAGWCGDRALVDVRSPQEYSGERWHRRAFVRSDLLYYGGKGVTADKKVTAYCRIGERSAHTWFVLHELLGFKDVRNYDGSWTEWGNLVGAPIER